MVSSIVYRPESIVWILVHATFFHLVTLVSGRDHFDGDDFIISQCFLTSRGRPMSIFTLLKMARP